MGKLVKKAIEAVKKAIVKKVVKEVTTRVSAILYSVTDLILAQVNGMVALIPTSIAYKPVVTTGATDRWADIKVDTSQLPSEAKIEVSDVSGNPDYDFDYVEVTDIPVYDITTLPIITCMYCNEDQNYVDENRIIAKRVIKLQNATRQRIAAETCKAQGIKVTKNPDSAAQQIADQVSADFNACWIKLRKHFETIIENAKAQIKAFDPLVGLDEFPSALGDIGASLPVAFAAIGKAAALGPNFLIKTTKLITNIISETTALASNPYTSSAAPGYAAKEIAELLQFVEDCKEQKEALEMELDQALLPISKATNSLNKMAQILHDNPATAILGAVPGNPINPQMILTLSEQLNNIKSLLENSIKKPIITAVNTCLLPLGGYANQIESALPAELKEEVEAKRGGASKYQTGAQDKMAAAQKSRQDSIAAAVEEVARQYDEEYAKKVQYETRKADLEAELERDKTAFPMYKLTDAQIKAINDEITHITEIDLPPIYRKLAELAAKLEELKKQMGTQIEAEESDLDLDESELG